MSFDAEDLRYFLELPLTLETGLQQADDSDERRQLTHLIDDLQLRIREGRID